MSPRAFYPTRALDGHLPGQADSPRAPREHPILAHDRRRLGLRQPDWYRSGVSPQCRFWPLLLSLTACTTAEREFRPSDGGAVEADAAGDESSPSSSVPTETKPEAGAASSSSSSEETSVSTRPSASSETTSSTASSGSGSSPTESSTTGETSTGETTTVDPCVPSGEESCFNGVDDDCNDLTDCADPYCSVGATCAPAGTDQGILVELGTDCPAGYSEAIAELYSGLFAEGCGGCACYPSATSCEGELFFYTDSYSCVLDSGATEGQAVALVTNQCPLEPLLGGFTYGYRVGSIRPMAGTGTCSPGGVASVGAPYWQGFGKYCVADQVGTGCQFGYACVPEQSAGAACFVTDSGCADDLSQQDWYEGYEDTRTCGDCRCDGSGSCDNVAVQVGNDWACLDDRPLTLAGGQVCEVTNYSAPAVLVGQPQEPSCSPIADVTGDLTPVKAHRFCCEK